MAPVSKWNQITNNRKVANRLKSLYGSVDDFDLWVGALAEDTYRGMVGKLVYKGLVEQFENLRDGDRYWYKKYLNNREKRELANLSKIIRRNTDIRREISNNVFYAN